MTDHQRIDGSTTGGLPPAPSLAPWLGTTAMPPKATFVDARVVLLCVLAMALGAAAGFIARLLQALIGIVTNFAFYGRWSADFISPEHNALGIWVIGVPVVGGLIVGAMARFGHKAIRGHGIPEAMEQVLTNESRIPARITVLKPLSAAVAIGTGGPFGAEGPIIATGGALGSLIGQVLHTNAAERKTLLAAGAAAGMAATFGSPVSAVLLAIELLLFEFRPQSLIPVALASAVATGVRMSMEGAAPMFAMPELAQPTGAALACYVVLGAIVGVVAVGVTRAVYAIEDAFDRLPIHWMWWPALGGLAVGLVGYFAPKTLGVGYSNISAIVSSKFTLQAVLVLSAMKFISWSISLSSGTSGGTLAPLFTIGGGVGLALGIVAQQALPGAMIDPRIAALVGMAAIFAGASRALLASIVFAFETTLQPLGLLPLLGGCTAAYLVSCLMMRQTIMTEKISRRGVRVPESYHADPLDGVAVREVATRGPVTLSAGWTASRALEWLQSGAPGVSHQGFPIVDAEGRLCGVATRKELTLAVMQGDARTLGDRIARPVVAVYDDCSLREAVDHMARHEVGRLPVLSREDPKRLVGIVTRSDVFAAYRERVDQERREASISSFARLAPKIVKPGKPKRSQSIPNG